MILREHNGDVIFTACRILAFCNDATEVELGAIEEGLLLSLLSTMLNFTVETDCAEAVELIKDSTPNTSIHAFRISNIRELIQERGIKLARISRDANGASHELARMGSVLARTAFWPRGFPQEISGAVSDDCNPTPV